MDKRGNLKTNDGHFSLFRTNSENNLAVVIKHIRAGTIHGLPERKWFGRSSVIGSFQFGLFVWKLNILTRSSDKSDSDSSGTNDKIKPVKESHDVT